VAVRRGFVGQTGLETCIPVKAPFFIGVATRILDGEDMQAVLLVDLGASGAPEGVTLGIVGLDVKKQGVHRSTFPLRGRDGQAGFLLGGYSRVERASGMARVKIMEQSVKEKAPAGTGWDYDFPKAVFAMCVGAIYLMFLDPKVNPALLMPIALVIGFLLPKSGQSNTIPLRLAASILTFLSCFFGAVLSEFRLGVKNDGHGLLPYCSSEHIAQAFGAAFHDAPYLWYFCAAGLAFILAARSPFKNKVSPAEKTDGEQDKKRTSD
jgi:hypothetical protein